jgi:hypothetical protein
MFGSEREMSCLHAAPQSCVRLWKGCSGAADALLLLLGFLTLLIKSFQRALLKLPLSLELGNKVADLFRRTSMGFARCAFLLPADPQRLSRAA